VLVVTKNLEVLVQVGDLLEIFNLEAPMVSEVAEIF
jgi:hypothetical protein